MGAVNVKVTIRATGAMRWIRWMNRIAWLVGYDRACRWALWGVKRWAKFRIVNGRWERFAADTFEVR